MSLSTPIALIRLCRPKHWLKNVLVFAPLIFSGNLLNPDSFFKTFIGWIAFNFTASAVYIFNDLRDIETDKLHEIKKYRPLAAGQATPAAAKILFCFLICAAAGTDFFASNRPEPAGLLLLYLVINILYSLRAKKIPLLDIAFLVLGFLIRIFYGASLIAETVSVWLYLTVTAMSAYLGLGKRRNELQKRIDNNHEINGVLKFYTPEFLDKNMYMCLTLTIAFYALWAISPIPAMPDPSNARIWTVPLVMLICMRYSLLIETKTYADPVDVLTSDKILTVLVMFYGIYMTVLMYGRTFF
ncbi:MAG: UbiA prenyltransferase family protein [Alphaproteobacteria bacterium]|nr:UbiA prenyltransferase family protein [Alphaproteobacteria bacterium]